jgi:hypothetical protein
MYTSFLSHNDFKRELRESISHIDNFFNNESDDLLFKDNSIVSSLVQRYAFFKNGDIHNKIIKPILLDAAIRSENIAGGSGDLCLRLLSKMISSSRHFNISHSDIEKLILKNSKRALRDDFYNLVERNASCDDHLDIFLFLFEKMNSSSPIFLERSRSSKTKISLDTGFNFNISIDKKYLTRKTIKMKDVRCFVIDGFVESVSEIHHVLEKAAESKDNYALFVRHLSEDVESTISYNVQRGTINLVPVSVGFDKNTLNILNDISLCTNSDIISSEKGDLISASVKREPVTINSIEFDKKSITIINKNPSSLLVDHIRYLKDKRETSLDPALFSIIEDRIKSLSSGKIVISIGTDLILKDPKTIEIFDKILRETRAIIKSGVVYSSDISDDDNIFTSILKDGYPYSSLSILMSLRNSLSAYDSLKSIHGVIYEDK